MNKHQIESVKDKFVTVCEIFEDDDKFHLVKDFMDQKNAVHIQEAVFDIEDIENAQWMTVRSSWQTQYPQPQDNMEYVFTTYNGADYCDGEKPVYYCGKGLIQNGCFVLKKEPNWGARNFMMLNWIGDELFVSRKAEKILSASDLSGFAFYDVLNSSKEKLNGIKQLFVKQYLPEGLCTYSIERKYVCPKCHFTKYLPKPGKIRFHKEIFDGISYDIVKTAEKFGEIGCDSLILINHKFYEVIKKANLERGLVFEPIEFI